MVSLIDSIQLPFCPLFFCLMSRELFNTNPVLLFPPPLACPRPLPLPLPLPLVPRPLLFSDCPLIETSPSIVPKK